MTREANRKNEAENKLPCTNGCQRRRRRRCSEYDLCCVAKMAENIPIISPRNIIFSPSFWTLQYILLPLHIRIYAREKITYLLKSRCVEMNISTAQRQRQEHTKNQVIQMKRKTCVVLIITMSVRGRICEETHKTKMNWKGCQKILEKGKQQIVYGTCWNWNGQSKIVHTHTYISI